jgi:hypothetical protein
MDGPPKGWTSGDEAWGEEVARGLGESAEAEDGPLSFESYLRQDERRKNVQEFGKILAELILTGRVNLPPDLFDQVRADERRKTEQEIAAWLAKQHRDVYNYGYHPATYYASCIEKGHHRPPQAAVPPPGPDPSEARGAVGAEGDRAAEGQGGAAPGIRSEKTEDWMNFWCQFRTPGEVFLKKRIDALLGANRRLEQDRAEAMALVLSHEGRIESQAQVINQLLEEAKENDRKHYQATLSLQQQLSEEKQYNAELEKRLKEESGRLCHEIESSAINYEGGRQEAEAEILACIERWLLPLQGEALTAAWRLHSIIKAGAHRAKDPYPARLFDRAQLRAVVEHETACQIADWYANRFPPCLEIPRMIREGEWREGQAEAGGGLGEVAPDNDDDRLPAAHWETPFVEGVAQAVAAEFAEADPEDWRWARQLTLALVRWTIGLSAAENTVVPNLRWGAGQLLTLIELGIDQEENK